MISIVLRFSSSSKDSIKIFILKKNRMKCEWNCLNENRRIDCLKFVIENSWRMRMRRYSSGILNIFEIWNLFENSDLKISEFWLETNLHNVICEDVWNGNDVSLHPPAFRMIVIIWCDYVWIIIIIRVWY